jgi:hypothetical protein
MCSAAVAVDVYCVDEDDEQIVRSLIGRFSSAVLCSWRCRFWRVAATLLRLPFKIFGKFQEP